MTWEAEAGDRMGGIGPEVGGQLPPLPTGGGRPWVRALGLSRLNQCRGMQTGDRSWVCREVWGDPTTQETQHRVCRSLMHHRIALSSQRRPPWLPPPGLPLPETCHAGQPDACSV